MTGVAVDFDTKASGDALLLETLRRLGNFDGTKTRIVIEVEYKRVGGATPAAARFIGVLFATFGTLPIGVTAVRQIAETDVWSQHAYSNAVDVMVSGELHRQVAFWCDANRSGLDIAHLLADPYFPSPLRNHTTHVHVDFYPQWGGTPPGHPV